MSQSVEPELSGLPEGASRLRFVLRELKPKGRLLTPFNLISGGIMAVALVLLVMRFKDGLGAIGDHGGNPWGLWIGFNVVGGVALAGGAYVVTFLVYVLGLKKYKPVVRSTVLFGFLSYLFYAGALLIDLGRPWNVTNPIFGNDFGVSSVLFLVAWHFLLYMTAQLVEFSPTVAEWLNARRARRLLSKLTLGAVVFGITLSLLHQSGLGALFLMAKPKIHPLWYSEYIPILFVVSSVFAGLSVVIVESSISRRVFRKHIDDEHRDAHPEIVLGLGRICVGAMFVYLFLLALTFLHGQNWQHIGESMGTWYLLEVFGFVVLPLAFFVRGLRRRNLNVIRAAAVMSIAGVILNRLNISIFAFKWYEPVRYWPSWMEIVVALAIICAQLWVFRWVGKRMPVRRASPAWVHEEPAPTTAKTPTRAEGTTGA